MADKCPICFSDIGTPTAGNFIWTDDPILTNPAPSVGVIVYEDYKGFTQLKAQHIKELQDNRKQIESDLGITPLTEFSVIDVDNLFQNIKQFITELRDSTEKILNFVGMTKDDYFNYDKDGNDMRPGNHQVDWTDIPFPVYDLKQFQSKAQHIEDLRHFIQRGFWRERFFATPIGDLVNVAGNNVSTDEMFLANEEWFNGDKGEWYENVYMTLGFSTTHIINGYSKGTIHVYVSSNGIDSNLMNISITGEAYCSTHPIPPIILAPQRRCDMDYVPIQFNEIISGINLKPTTRLSMISSATLSGLIASHGPCGIIFEVSFGSGRTLEYAYGRSTHYQYLGRKIITLNNFNNLTRIIGADYITEWGSLLPGETIAGVGIFINFTVLGAAGVTNQEHMTASVTDIKIQ